MVRRHANLFITLFALVCPSAIDLHLHAAFRFADLDTHDGSAPQLLSTGINELKSESDIQYVRDAFALDISEEEAMSRFKKLIFKSLNTTATQINNAIHILAHS